MAIENEPLSHNATAQEAPPELVEWRQNAGDRLFPKFNQEVEESTGVAGLNYGLTVNALMEAIFENPMATDDTVLEAARANVQKGRA